MKDKTILVIDDSATIRKLVDTHLSPVGYQVVLAPNAEDGLRLAEEIRPDLILLDHQLPGTTGFEVASMLAGTADLKFIPVVISSTLRKKAYAEYTDLDNVVDMLPKPYTEELLQTTVANALETAAMVVGSQAGGTAVPETINQVTEADLAGSFSLFGLRELLDFINNGNKCGVLEVEADRIRLWFYLNKGRIQGITATGIGEDEIDEMVRQLPDSLTSLAPVLKLTVGGKSCAEVDGFVQLLDQKVLDPRLMTKLLRYQASMLIRLGFTRKLNQFRFIAGEPSGKMHRQLPLETSLLALLVEASLHSADYLAAGDQSQHVFSRRAIRGQNLDRAGLSARHMKILSLLSDARPLDELATRLGWSEEEVQRVLHGFQQAELVESRVQCTKRQVVVFEPEITAAQQARQSLQETQHASFAVKVVRDRLGLQLMLKRACPDAIFFAADDEEGCQFIHQLFKSAGVAADKVKRVAISSLPSSEQSSIDWNSKLGFTLDAVIPRPYTAELLFRTLDKIGNHAPAQANSESIAPIESSVVNTFTTSAVGAH